MAGNGFLDIGAQLFHSFSFSMDAMTQRRCAVATINLIFHHLEYYFLHIWHSLKKLID